MGLETAEIEGADKRPEPGAFFRPCLGSTGIEAVSVYTALHTECFKC